MTETWNADNPKTSNQVQPDVLDIEENFDYLIHRFGYRVDASAADQSASGTVNTVAALATAIGTSKTAVLFFPHHMKDGNTTTYTFADDLDLTSYTNLVFRIQPGAQLSIDNTKTLTIGGPVIAKKVQWVTGSGTLTWIWNGLVWGNYDGTSTNAIHPTLDDAVDLGTSSLEFKDLFIDGTANIDALVADTADIDGGTVDGANVGATTPGTGDFTTIGATTPGTGAFTTISASGDSTLSGNIFVTKNVLETTSKGEPTAGSQTITAAMLLGGFVDEDPEGDATWTTDTAANIVAAITNCVVGTTFRCLFYNDATNASVETITLAAGAGVTLHGETVISSESCNTIMELVFRVTNITGASEAIDCYILQSDGSGRVTGDVRGRGLLADGDPGSGVASVTTITNATAAADTNEPTLSQLPTSAPAGDNAGWLKVWIGTSYYWIPYWASS